MFLDAPIMADRELGGVNKRDSGALPRARMQIHGQWHKRSGKAFHKVRRTDKLGELSARMNTHTRCKRL